MNIFGKLPQERAMQSLIHDTNRELSILNQKITDLTKWLNENSKQINSAGINTARPYVSIEYLKTTVNSIRAAIDEYTVKFKDDFPDTNTPNP